jgi:outer membrane receptor protein involved in Fe transport
MQFKTSKRLSFNSQLFTAGKRYVKDYTNETRIDPVTQTSSLYVYEKIKQLDPVFDMNIGAQYSVTEKISAFLQLNNLTSSSYSLWNNYPVKGFNVLLGASYNF